MGKLISNKYAAWKQECEDRFQQLKANEEELNRIFIDIYGLQNELTPEVADKDVTVHRVFDSKENMPESMKGSNYVRTMRDEIVSLISYAVGCMFGRYSLDVEGLAYAGGEWDSSKYKTFIPDADNIIPITDEEYLDDDIVSRLCAWLKVVYGADTLEANLDYIAKALGNKGSTSREIIRNYFLNSTNVREVAAATKRKEKLQKQLKECREYDEKIGHLALSRIELDLDDGVKKNYRKIQTAVDGKFYEVLADSNTIMAKEK